MKKSKVARVISSQKEPIKKIEKKRYRELYSVSLFVKNLKKPEENGILIKLIFN